MAHTEHVDVRPWQLRLIASLAAIAAVHSVAVALWLAPSSPVRDSVGATTLATYVFPYFQQSWGQLAPSSQRIDETLNIRAHVRDAAGQETFTRWIDVTAQESSDERHDWTPERANLASRRLAANLNSVMFSLNPAQRRLVRDNYVSTPVSRLRSLMQKAGPDSEPVSRYVVYDEMAARFASMYMAAVSGETVIEVQYRVGRRSVPDFSDRSTSTLADTDYLWFSFGWRKAYQAPLDAQDEFSASVNG